MPMATRKAAPALSKKRRPNILYVMFDQLAPQFLPSYGHKVVQGAESEPAGGRGRAVRQRLYQLPAVRAGAAFP